MLNVSVVGSSVLSLLRGGKWGDSTGAKTQAQSQKAKYKNEAFFEY